MNQNCHESAQTGYSTSNGQVQCAVNSGIPFTGYDVGLGFLGAAILICLGVGLRKFLPVVEE